MAKTNSMHLSGQLTLGKPKMPSFQSGNDALRVIEGEILFSSQRETIEQLNK
jgi:hypothetical protein